MTVLSTRAGSPSSRHANDTASWVRRSSCGVGFIFAAAIGLAGCSDDLGPNEARYLAPLLTAEMGIEGPNPRVTRVGETAWDLEIGTFGGCPLVRRETEIIYRERNALIFPYEVRQLCPDRPIRGGWHEVTVSFRGEGPWVVFIMGDPGVQWADTLHAEGRDPG